MRKILTVIAAAILCLASGCATSGNYHKRLNNWVGHQEKELLNSWGPPSSSYESEGSKYLSYIRGSNIHIPGTAPSYHTTYFKNNAYTTQYGGAPGYNMNLWCNTVFVINENTGKIVNWRTEGNNCVSD